ncbi:MAG: hypothetical protein Q9222_002991 [Ikaeria aurantiellina]
MAFIGNSPLFRHFRTDADADPEALSRPQRDDVLRNSNSGFLGRLSHDVFKQDSLARQLDSHHITGIAFSSVVGIGIYQTSGEVIALGGPVGALLAFIFVALVIFSVMRCLAEMVSVRPVTAPLIDFPHTFVDEALGFAVGIMYWLANCMSMVTLIIAAAMFTQYWPSSLGMTSATFVILLAIYFMNACGVQLYGRMEWVFKWLKITMLVGISILMICIKAGVGPGRVDSNFELSPGYKSNGFFANDKQPAVAGTGGRILTVWTCTTIAMFQFMGGEIVLVTAGEAKRPLRDLPIAARYMYLLPSSFYLVLVLLVGLNINYLDPRLYHSHTAQLLESRLDGLQTAASSPFVIVVENAGIRALPGFLDACYIFSALTAANSALYVSSRTLFTLAQRSSIPSIKRTIGRTNNGNTPLAAITVSFVPGALAFLAVRARERVYQELIHVMGRLYTGPMLCIYAAQCLAFLRFLSAIKFYNKTIDRDGQGYRDKHYRAHWQPLWAILGLTLCTLLMVFSGWAAIYDLSVKSPDVDRGDSIVDLVASYLGVHTSDPCDETDADLSAQPFLFFMILIIYKLVKRTRIRSVVDDMRDVWFVRYAPLDEEELARPSKRRKNGRLREFLSWVK